MCGIWSFITKDEKLKSDDVKGIVKELFILSESRGKEASGIASMNHDVIDILKAPIAGSELIREKAFEEYWIRNTNEVQKEYVLVGHSRLSTNGSEKRGDNNQPVFDKNIVTVHNGIIVNVEKLWQKYADDIEREHQVDTEIFVKLYERFLGENYSVNKALEKVYSEIQGMASTISILGTQNMVVAASNNGSLYYCISNNKKSIVVASERLIVSKAIKKCSLQDQFLDENIIQIKPYQALYIGLPGLESQHIEFNQKANLSIPNRQRQQIDVRCQYGKNRSIKKKFANSSILGSNKILRYDIDLEPIKRLRRCTRCVLPETMPFIEFDENGVCNYCKTYQKQNYKGEQKLKKWARQLQTNQFGVDSLVAFSGGRDSSYGLHYFVKELGLRPVAYSYDWGMVTDLARRNQSRMCAQLGVELVVVSANIRKKRENIRKNVEAWLKKPDVGMIPLFMAGDKHYFYYANKVRSDFKINTVLLASNPFEKTYFKAGYCGVKPEILRKGEEKRAMERLPVNSILKMSGHYIGQYLRNTSYINSSIWDTAKATLSYYIIPHDYFLLFDYIPWDENIIDEVLINQYDWETATDTKSTWRIGDGTAPFYNYIYYLTTGFTENDTLRSNQIREGMLTREQALEKIYEDNQPRFDSMKWYFDTIGVSMYDALEIVSKMKKYY